LEVSARKIRVLIVTHTLGQGGLEEVVRTYAELLDKDQFEVTIAYMVGGRVSRECESIARVRLIHISTPNRMRRLFQLVRIAREMRCDVLHNHLSWYGLLAGAIAGVKRVETIHNTYRWLTGKKRWAFALSCLLAHRLIAVSAAVESFTIDFFPFMSERKFVVIYNGIILQRFCPSKKRHEVRNHLGLSEEDFLVTFVGRLEEQKGLAFLLDAVNQLNQRYTNLKVLLVGEGSLEQSLREYARRLSLQNIYFLGYREDVANLLAASDVFVLPSVYEGLPLTVLQAMAVGCPTVVSRVGGLPEVVLDGVTGFLVEPGSIDQLRDRIDRLYNDARLRSTFSRNALETVGRQFTAEMMVGKTERIYEQLIGVL
jgi:glycosyltransferase involved in cell wall biosynthesis